MLFLQTFMTNLDLTKSSGPKCHPVAYTALIFARFCVCHTDLSGGRQVGWACKTELVSVHSKNVAGYLAIVGLTEF